MPGPADDRPGIVRGDATEVRGRKIPLDDIDAGMAACRFEMACRAS